MTKQIIDIDFLDKYSKPGPRYTSYPTAPQFHEQFGPNDAKLAIAKPLGYNSKAPVSLYFHIPFCEHKCVYCGCNTIITRSGTRIENYLADLYKEIEMVSAMINPERKVVQMHFGGGTPTYLEPAQMTALVSQIKAHFNFSADAEISIEIDPRTLADGYLAVLRGIGFNRLSFGVQDLDPRVQKEIKREVLEERLRRLINEAHDLKYDSVNYDLMYGLPSQTLSSFSETIGKILSLSPDRLAVYNFAYLPDSLKNQRKIDPATLPSTDERLRMLKFAIEELTGSGYEFIGMDHFAKPGDELTLAMKNNTLHRNFQGYTTKAGSEVFALGVTGISQLERYYYQNAKGLLQYNLMVNSGKLPVIKGIELDNDDYIRKNLITRIMCNNYINKAKFGKDFGVDFDSYFNYELNSMDEFVKDKLVVLAKDSISITTEGRFAIRNIAMLFDEYLRGKSNKIIQYSKTV